MSNISQWGASASGNAVATPNGWPDAQAPSTVKNVGREMMAATRRQFEDEPWFDWGDSKSKNNLSFVSASSFKLDGDATGRYVVNRRLRITDTATLYASVTDSTYTANTLVTVNLDSGAITASITAVALSNVTPLGLPPTVEVGDNMLINGDFVVAQRGTAFTAATTPANNDDTYLLDRWILQSDGNDVMDVSQITTTASLPAGARSSVKLLVATADKKAGMCTILENKDSIQAVGGVVSFSFKAKKGSSNTNLDKLRVGIIGWSGTADTVTSDLVADSSWGAEGANPDLATNWSFQNTPSDLTLSSGYITYEIEAVNVAASLNNLGVFVWVDNTDATLNDAVYFTDCQLNVGGSAGKFEVRPFEQELQLCQRYYEKSYPYATQPGTATENGKAIFSALYYPVGDQGSTRKNAFTVNFNTPKRSSSPTFTAYPPNSTSSGNIRILTRSAGSVKSDASVAISQFTQSGLSEKNVAYIPANATEIHVTSFSASAVATMELQYTVESEL